MDKINAKAIISALLSGLLLLLLTSLVGAVNIIFYSSDIECDGVGFSFNSIGSDVCVEGGDGYTGSVMVTDASSDYGSAYYSDANCDSDFVVANSTGESCVTGGDLLSALWYGPSRRRSLLGKGGSSKSDRKMKPTGVVYTEDSSKGYWTLTCSDAAALVSQLKNITDAEKVNWFISRGATYISL